MRRINTVAQITFRETIRNKILLYMIAFALVMFILAWIVGSWSLGETGKIIADLGLSITALVGVIIGIFAGIVLVWNEVERHTVLPVLAKPLSRWEFILGKFFGFSASVLLVYAGMALILVLQLLVIEQPVAHQLFWSIYLSAWEILLVLALAVMFSAFTSPSLSALFTIILFVAGRFSWDIKVFIQHNPAASTRPVLEAVYAVIPHLAYFNVRHEAVHGLPIPLERLAWPTTYGLVYCGVVLLIAVLAFNSRDLA